MSIIINSYLYSSNQYEFTDKNLYIHVKVATKRKKMQKASKRHKKRTRRKPFVHHTLINKF